MRISDWSSDVCSSDLSTASQLPDTPAQLAAQQGPQGHPIRVPDLCGDLVDARVSGAQEMDSMLNAKVLEIRSEERRVGEECGSQCRSWWSQCHYTKTKYKYMR